MWLRFTSLSGAPVLINMDAASTVAPASKDDLPTVTIIDYTVTITDYMGRESQPLDKPDPVGWLVIDGKVVKGEMDDIANLLTPLDMENH